MFSSLPTQNFLSLLLLSFCATSISAPTRAFPSQRPSPPWLSELLPDFLLSFFYPPTIFWGQTQLSSIILQGV
jgi:hypothetical protein